MMRLCWRFGFVVGLAALGTGPAAIAQVSGTAASVPAAGAPAAGAPAGAATAAGGQDSGTANGGVSDQSQSDAALKAEMAKKSVAAQQRSSAHFDRVTSERRVTATGPAARSSTQRQADALRAYTAESMRSRMAAPDPRVPTGSSWQGIQKPNPSPPPPPVTVRTRVNNYFPGMRPSRQPNANTAQVTGVRRGGMMMMPRAMMPMTAGSSAQARAAVRGQSAAPVPGRR
jgi:hypothetical protein